MIPPAPRLELPLDRRPRLSRPEEWVPRWGDRVIFVRGGDYPTRTVRILTIDAEPGRHLIALDRLMGTVPASRLWPLPNWREVREREDRERGGDEESGGGGEGGEFECPF